MTEAETGRAIFRVLARYRGPARFWRTDCAIAAIAVYRHFGMLGGLAELELRRPGDISAALRAHGGDLTLAASALAERAGFRRLEDAGAARLLDLGLCRTEGGEALAVHNGLGFLTRGPRGPILITHADRAWRAPALEGAI